MIVEHDFRVLWLREGRTEDISPTPGLVADRLRSRAPGRPGERFAARRTHVGGVGGSPKEIWFTAGEAVNLDLAHAAADSENHLDVLRREEVRDPEGPPVLFVYRPAMAAQGWHTAPLEELSRLDPKERTECTLEVRQSALYLGASSQSAQEVASAIDRAGWIEPDRLYYVLARSDLSVGRVRRCEPELPLRRWKVGVSYRSAVGDRDARVLRVPGGLEVLTPTTFGIAATEIPLRRAPIWRTLLWHSIFGGLHLLGWATLTALATLASPSPQMTPLATIEAA